MVKYIFCDTGKEVVEQFQKTFEKRTDSIVYKGKFVDFLQYKPQNIALICPMTSLGSINKVFNDAFPKLSSLIEEQIKIHGGTNLGGNKFIEVGSAISILYSDEADLRILCISTMYTKHDIDNIYYGFLAAKNLVKKINKKYPEAIKTIICPVLAEIDSEFMISQINKALKSKSSNDLRSNIPYFYSNNDASKTLDIVDEIF